MNKQEPISAMTAAKTPKATANKAFKGVVNAS